VHRDLKPGNILVTGAGLVKLLDFGISKLLQNDAVTATVERRFTPAYASPEQIRGGPITAATDVYALGLVLYELLTGALPHASATLKDMARRLEERRLRPPSQTPGLSAERRRAIEGDLDRIVLHALETDPEKRYPSVEQLLADVARYRGGYPIEARQPSAAYRARKFIGRNRLAVGAVAVAMSGMAAGTAVAVWKARLAQREQAAAERRFHQLQSLAHSVMFDLHDAIRGIPGTVEARRTLVATALRYLDGLNAEQIRDDGLQLELAGAYYRMAWVQSGLGSQNIGDTAGSRRSYESALRILDGLWKRHAGDPKIGALRFAVVYNLALTPKDPAEGLALAARYAAEAARWADEQPGSASLNAAALLQQAIGRLRNRTGDLAGAIDAVDHATALFDRLLKYTSPEKPLPLASDEVTYRGVLHAEAIDAAVRAGTLADMGRADDAMQAHQTFLRLERAAQGVQPGSAAAAGMLVTAHAFQCDVALLRGRVPEAIAEARTEIEGMQAVAERDKRDVSALRDLADAHRHLGQALWAKGDAAGCVRELAVAADGIGKVAATDPGLLMNRSALAGTLNDYAAALARAGRHELSRAKFRAAFEIADAALREAPSRVDLLRERARAEAGLGDAQRSEADLAEFHRRSPLNRRPFPSPGDSR
jgi:non-specific serine/threonine protein kinase/serine/threonine-protein kinase